MSNLFRFISLRNLRNKPFRTTVTILGIAFGVALFVAIGIINQSTLVSFRETVEAVTGKATLTITAGENGFPEDRLDLIKKVPGVRTAVPIIQSHAYFARGEGSSETLMVLGVDLLKEQSVRSYETDNDEVIDDPLVFLNQPDSIIITQTFAKEHGLHIDSHFRLATSRGAANFTVRGMLAPKGPAVAFGGAMAIMDIDGARASFGKEGKLDRVDLLTRNGANLDQIAEQEKTILGPGYSVERADAQVATLSKLVSSYQVMLGLFSTLALLVGLFLIANTVSISVTERRKEIGSLRALGASRSSVMILFLTEAVFMGGTGAFIGAWAGRGLASVLLKMILQVLQTQYQIRIDVSHLLFGPLDILRAVLIGVATSLLASLWPAFRATRISPLEAMRKNEMGDEASSRGVFFYLPWIGLSLLIYLNLSAFLNLSKALPAFQILNQISPMLAATFTAPWMVIGAIRLSGSLLGRWGGAVTVLSEKNLLRNSQRTQSNVIGMIVGLVLVVMIASMNSSFKGAIVDWFNVILRADLVVSSNGDLLSNQTQPLDESVGKSIEQIPGVLMGPERGAYGIRTVRVNYEDKPISIKAFDEPDPARHYDTFDLQDRSASDAGHELFHSSDPVTFVSQNFVLNFKKKTGDIIEVPTPTGSLKMRIVGVVVDWASPVGVLNMSREQYKKYWQDPLVNNFAVFVGPQASAEQVRKEIDGKLGMEKNLSVISSAEMRGEMISTINRSFSYTLAIQGAALIVGLLGLLNTILSSVMSRTREIGLLRAIGMSKRQVRSMILQEAILQGGFGALAATILGVWVSALWVRYCLTDMLGWTVSFSLPVAAIGVTIGLGVAMALLAGIYPARRANQMQITEAIDYE